MFYSFQNFAQVKNWRYQQYWGHLSLEKKRKKKYISAKTRPFIPQLRSTYYIFRSLIVHILCVGSVSSNYSDTSQVLPFRGIIWPETNKTKSRNISWCLAQRCWYNTSKYASNPQCKGIFFELLKFMFSKKATKFDKIFTVDLTLCSKCQIDSEDFVNFCGLLRKHEL